MAEQIGPFQFKGKLGNLVGKHVNGKNIVTTPGGLTSRQIKDKSRISNKRIHENWNEFKMATRLANKIYQNLKGQTSIAHFHPDAQARLTGEILKFRLLDTTSARGERKPTAGALSLLKDYFLSDPKLNVWASPPQMERIDDSQIKITIQNPEAAFNFYTEHSDFLKVKVIVQQIDLENRTVLNVASFDQNVDYNSAQPVEWTAQLFPDYNLVTIATHFFKENNGYVFPLYERKRCSCFIADFFVL